MTFLEKMRAIPGEARAIRESLSLVDHTSDSMDDEIQIHAKKDKKVTEARKRRNAAVLEMANMFNEVFAGTRPVFHLKEAMTTSDFPLLFGDVLYRLMLGAYTTWPSTYQNYFKVRDLTDFRTLNMYQIDGGGGPPLAAVPERTQYPETKWTEAKTTLAVAKYGRRYSVSFEMMVNDDLQAFQDRPQTMAADARMSEEYLATTKMFDANGPHASFYTSGNANIITSNPALSINALMTAMTILGNMKDSANRPIVVEMVRLVVPPALEITARNILNAIELRINENGGATNSQLITTNWMKNRVGLDVNPFIPIVVTSTTTTTRGNTSWALVGSPAAGRPAFNFGFLRGYRAPQLSMKAPNQVAIGGTLGQMDGDFDTDSIDYRVRHMIGAGQGDPKLSVASNGTGS